MPRFEDFDTTQDGYISEQELIGARSMHTAETLDAGSGRSGRPVIEGA